MVAAKIVPVTALPVFVLASLGLVASANGCKQKEKAAPAYVAPAPTPPSPAQRIWESTEAAEKALPPPAPGRGHVIGAVTFGGDAAPGIEVKLCEKFNSLLPGGPVCEGAVYKATTDARGIYSLRDVPAGKYDALLVRVFDTALFQYSKPRLGIGAVEQEIHAGAVLRAEQTSLVKSDMTILAPRPMARTSATPTIRWQDYPGAKEYAITIKPSKYEPAGRKAIEARVATASFVPTAPLAPGRWRVDLSAWSGAIKLSELDSARELVVPSADDATPLDGDPPPPPPLAAAPPKPDAITPAAGAGAVTGVVFFGDAPAPGIDVRLCQDYDFFGSGCSGSILTARTDSRGIYTFPKVKPRAWGGLTVRRFDTRDVMYVASGFGAKTFDVAADQTLTVAPTYLFKTDLKVAQPAASATLHTARPEIRITPYPAAATYYFTLTGQDNAEAPSYKNIELDRPSFVLDKPLPNGSYSLSAAAYSASGKRISETKTAVSFRVDSR